MAITNHERVGKALDLLKEGLGPFVEREVQRARQEKRVDDAALVRFAEDTRIRSRPISEWDAAALLKLMWDVWNEVFRPVLGHAERNFVSELRRQRNEWAHQEPFTSDDAYRVLDTAGRLLTSISSPQAATVDKLRMELRRVQFDEQVRGARRKKSEPAVGSRASGSLKPWREIATPHKDVSSGLYQQAEFAADLWQVHLGEGAAEYREPVEFFHRTYLTESLKGMLAGAVRRLSGQGGDPVVQLQTNFGGGKTHSMLALYHLFSDTAPSELAGVDTVLREAEINRVPSAKRVVLVGNKISPGNPVTKNDGTVVRTLWGELAWQLGGTAGFSRLAADDERATSPGDVLREILADYGPCLILIDEWVAYARQLHDRNDLPAGGFETQFTFAQVLTESVKAVDNCLLVVSLPASDVSESPHAEATNVEVGGQRGREALDRLRNVIGRIESSWRPASAEEGFEIVRRRLFEPFADSERFKDRDIVARAFADFYRTKREAFPPECRDADYEVRLKEAYPIHPEVFDRLYSDWSTLVTFQRTRGVLRLMAAVIHSLWRDGDRSPLILPANLSIDDPQVLSELTRYLPDTWTPVIRKDVDGQKAIPRLLDEKEARFGEYSACRRIARTVYLGSAPGAGAGQRGIEHRRVTLGCLLPGEPIATFDDALRRLARKATFLYEDGSRYWYDTRPTLTKLAEDRAEELRREQDKIAQSINERLRTAQEELGGFSRIHIAPLSGDDVPDEREVRLVVLGTDHYHHRDSASPAQKEAGAILESRGTVPRLYRNTLVFLAPDQSRLQDLSEAVRWHLAWKSILEERDNLDLSPNLVRQAETQHEAAAGVVTTRLPETYQWLLTPLQAEPGQAVTWEATRLTGQGDLAGRALRQLRDDELLATSLAGTILRRALYRNLSNDKDKPAQLWRGNHVSIRQIIEDFASYLYLPRAQGPTVLLRAVVDGVGLLTWERDGFAYADSFSEESNRYEGLRGGSVVDLADTDSHGLLVRPDVARKQFDEEICQRCGQRPPMVGSTLCEVCNEKPPPPPPPELCDECKKRPRRPGSDRCADCAPQPDPTRFHGSVGLDSVRAGAEASRIAEEVIAHLTGLVGAEVSVTLEIHADMPDGAPQHVVRTVTENSRDLKFTSFGFEQE